MSKNNAKPSSVFRRMIELPRVLFKARLSNNFALKLLSLVLAVLFWVFVMDQVNPEIQRTIYAVPVQLINRQEVSKRNLQIMNEHDYFVNVVITGRRNTVLPLNTSSIHLTADMRSLTDGTNLVPIQALVDADAVTVKLLTPNEISLSADRIVSIPKPVRVDLTGDFSEGFSAAEIMISPAEVRVTGPESIVNTVSYLQGSTSAGNIKEDTSREVIVEAYSFDGSLVGGVRLEQSYVTARIAVDRKVKLPLVFEFDEQPDEGYGILSVKIATDEVEIIGPAAVVDAIEKIETEKIVVRGSEPYSGTTSLILPEGVRAVDSRSVRYDVVIEPIESADFTFISSEIPFRNLAPGLRAQYVLADGQKTVRATALSSVLAALRKTQIQPYLDLEEIREPGQYLLRIRFDELDDVVLTAPEQLVELTVEAAQ